MSLNHFLKSSLISNLNSNIPKRFYTVIVERIKKPPIPKKGVDPRRINLKSVNYQYRFVECKHNKSWGNVDLILTQYVEGVGHKGEIVSIPRMQAYYELLPARLAVYPTQEYLEMYAEDRKALSTKSKVSPFAMKTKEELSKLLLEIPMNTEAEWTLNEDYIRLALRYNVGFCFISIQFRLNIIFNFDFRELCVIQNALKYLKVLI